MYAIYMAGLFSSFPPFLTTSISTLLQLVYLLEGHGIKKDVRTIVL